MNNFPKNILQIGYALNDQWVIIEFVGKGAALYNPDTPFLKKWDQIIQDAMVEKKEERFTSAGNLGIAILETLNILVDNFKTSSIHGKLLQMSDSDVSYAWGSNIDLFLSLFPGPSPMTSNGKLHPLNIY